MLVDQRRSRHGHRVTVLGSFTAAVDGDPVPLGADARRTVAYLAVHRGPQRRAALAADLWPGVPAAQSRRPLDEALAEPLAVGLLVGDPDGAAHPDSTVALDPAVEVDLDEAMALVRSLTAAAGARAVPADLVAATALLRADLLPGERAAWLAVERERFRQIRLNALEELSAVLSEAGRHAEAVELAQELVHTAPSRESARRALIEAHLAQGEIAEAVAQYDEYQELLRSSVGAPGADGAFGLEALLPPVPAWPVLRVRRSMQRIGMSPPGVRVTRHAPRRLVSGGSPGTVR
jgi:DNA-binding SARP family transcriptional activator